MTISNEHWKEIEEAYGNLIYVIATKISGDKAFSTQDYVQMLYLKTLSIIKAYEKKVNKEFKEIWTNPKSKVEFGQWLKTCLWNYKNTIGKELKIRHKFLNSQMPIDTSSDKEEGVVNEIVSKDHCTLEDSMNIKWIHELLDNNSKHVLKLIIDNPNCLTSSGLLNKLALIELSGLKESDVVKSIDKISYLLQKGIWN